MTGEPVPARFLTSAAGEWEGMVAANRPGLGDGFFAHLETRIKAAHVCLGANLPLLHVRRPASHALRWSISMCCSMWRKRLPYIRPCEDIVKCQPGRRRRADSVERLRFAIRTDTLWPCRRMIRRSRRL